MATRQSKSGPELPNQLTFKVAGWIEATAVGRFAIVAVIVLIAVVILASMGRADLVQTALEYTLIR